MPSLLPRNDRARLRPGRARGVARLARAGWQEGDECQLLDRLEEELRRMRGVGPVMRALIVTRLGQTASPGARSGG